MSNSKEFPKSGVTAPSLGNNFTDNQDTDQPSLATTGNRRMSGKLTQDTSSSFINVPSAVVLPQPSGLWLFPQSRDCKEELSDDDTELANTTFDYFNLKKLQPSNSSAPSNLPQPPKHWLKERMEYGSKAEESEEEQEMAKKTDTFDYYNLKKLLNVGSYGQLEARNSPQASNSSSNVPVVSALPQPPRHWLLERAQSGCKEDEMEREMARLASTYDFYNLKMLLMSE